MQARPARLSTLLRSKGSLVYELRRTLKPAYALKIVSAYNVAPKGKRTPTEYRIYAQVEDRRKRTRIGAPIRLIAGRKVPTVYAGRKVTTAELNRVLKRLPGEAGEAFIRSSYDTELSSKTSPNYFKFRFSLTR